MSDITIQASLERKPDFERIAGAWQSLEARSRPSFFLSWQWIGTWLRVSGQTPDLLVARRGEETVGLALLCRKQGSWRTLCGPSFHLTAAGGGDQDSPFIEYNGALLAVDTAEAAAAVMLARLAGLPRFGDGWCRLGLPGVSQEMRDLLARSGLALRDEVVRQAPFVDLDVVRRTPGNDFLETRSRNFRSQVRRSMRLYGAEGEVRLEPARDQEDAFRALDELKELHQRRWTGQGQPGAFSPFFERFHRALVAAAWASGSIELLRLRAGQATVGYLYNFVHGGCAYAYQSGFDFGRDARHKPGLVSHTLAAQRYLDAGLQRYLLLAGDSVYKRSLANGSDVLCWSVARRPGVFDTTLDLAQRLAARGLRAAGRLAALATGQPVHRPAAEPYP